MVAIALGICDGLTARVGQPCHDLKAAANAAALSEMATIVELCGGRLATAYGLPGVGHLEVTGLYGRRDGADDGRGPDGGGYSAASFAARLVDEKGGSDTWARLPLLRMLSGTLAAGSYGEDPESALARAVMPRRRG